MNGQKSQNFVPSNQLVAEVVGYRKREHPVPSRQDCGRHRLTGLNNMPDSTTPAPDFSDVSGGGSSEAMSAAASQNTAQTYTVVSGDSLSKIAKHFYGDSAKWKSIWEANKSAIKNPDLVQIGQVLTIPKL